MIVSPTLVELEAFDDFWMVIPFVWASVTVKESLAETGPDEVEPFTVPVLSISPASMSDCFTT